MSRKLVLKVTLNCFKEGVESGSQLKQHLINYCSLGFIISDKFCDDKKKELITAEFVSLFGFNLIGNKFEFFGFISLLFCFTNNFIAGHIDDKR
jgi:hypothetical protein